MYSNINFCSLHCSLLFYGAFTKYQCTPKTRWPMAKAMRPDAADAAGTVAEPVAAVAEVVAADSGTTDFETLAA